jgi:hypothetical protein
MNGIAKIYGIVAEMNEINTDFSRKVSEVSTDKLDDAQPIIQDAINRMKALRLEISRIITGNRIVKETKENVGKALDCYVKCFELAAEGKNAEAEVYRKRVNEYLM